MAFEKNSTRNPLGLLPQFKPRSIAFTASAVVNVVAAATSVFVAMSGVHEYVDMPRYENVALVFAVKVPEPPKLLPKPRVEPVPHEEPAKIQRREEPRDEPEPDLSGARLDTSAMPELPASPARIAALLLAPSNVPPTPAISPASHQTAGTPDGGVVQPSGAVSNPPLQPSPTTTPLTVGSFQQTIFGAQGTSSTPRGSVRAISFASGIGAGSSRTGNADSYGSAPFGEGAGGPNTSGAGTQRGGVKGTGFGSVAPVPESKHADQPPTSALPIITFEPQPRYTSEAIRLKIQGEVILQARLCASGRIDVLRVMSGLGYGLDEEAVTVTQHIRFKPALKNGQPIDEVTLVHVTFHLS